MDDDISQRINGLVEEEHRLQAHTAQAGASEADHRRLQEIEVQLDQCWDLLRQRRARRSAGQDPDEVSARPAEVVEHYQQ